MPSRERGSLFQAHYFATYYYAGLIRNWLEDPLAVSTMTEGFWCDGQVVGFSPPFPRHSALHSFIEYVIRTMLFHSDDEMQLENRQKIYRNFIDMPEALNDLQPHALAINLEMAGHGVEHESFSEWLKDNGKTFLEADADDIYEYHQDLALSEEFDTFSTQVAEEVFFILFQNRLVLLHFNEWLAGHLVSCEPATDLHGDFERYFARPGLLKRVDIPAWAQNAVFFRDRGKCTSCFRDLSGLLAPSPPRQFDHIVPLARGGLNDVTNLQLLCADCNSGKGAHEGSTSLLYQRWY
jgi:hypothetical protein